MGLKVYSFVLEKKTSPKLPPKNEVGPQMDVTVCREPLISMVSSVGNTQGCYQSISINGSRLFEDGQIFTGFKSEGDGSFRFRRLTSSMAPRCAVSSSASPDGTIGHATLTPQGDHSRTQLVLTPQSLNSWGSPLPLLDIIFWAAASSLVLCYPVTL